MNKSIILDLLHQEVIPALGCTEPAAVAFAVATAGKALGGIINKVHVKVSKNIYKNALAVMIPNTNEFGLTLAAALGLISKQSEKGLRIFDDITPQRLMQAKQLIAEDVVNIELDKSDGILISVDIRGVKGNAQVLIRDGHTQLEHIIKNGNYIYKAQPKAGTNKVNVDFTKVSFSSLIKMVEELPYGDISFLYEGLEMNMLIANEGLKAKYGLGVGFGLKKLIEKGVIKDDLGNKTRMVVAAACDARMAGVNLPVMSSMGSGNHGIAAIIPIAVLSERMGIDKIKSTTALALSHVITAYVKQQIGKLSAACGCAVAAGAGAAAAITWLLGGKDEQIIGAVKNIIGNLAGMLCDGAKGGCALKLSTSAGEAILAAQLALADIIIGPQDGIISSTIEDTVTNIGIISTSGMICTDDAILNIMLSK